MVYCCAPVLHSDRPSHHGATVRSGYGSRDPGAPEQVAIAEQKLHKPVRAPRLQRFTLALLSVKLKSSGALTIKQLRDVIRIFQPQTVLGWQC